MSFDPPPPPPPPPSDNDPHHSGGVPGYPNAPQYPGGPGGTGGPQYASGFPANHPNATVILVLGILGLLICGPVGVAAWVMGNKAIKEIDSSHVVYGNRGTVQAGRILGIIATAFLILQVALLIFLIATGGLVYLTDLANS